MKIIAFLFVSVVTVLTSCAGSPQESTIYKGEPKHLQPPLAILPAPNIYKLNHKLANPLQLQLNMKIDELFIKHKIAGISATILIPKKGNWDTRRGFISKSDNIIVDNSTVFYWASVTKLITSVIIHKLVLEDKLSFNDKLSNWFPDIQYSNKITIEQLLTHTNGIYSFNSDPDFHFSNKSSTPDELLEISKSKDNLFIPDEYWSYTNTGYLLLALIIEEIESKTFGQVVKDRISTPLKLKTLKTATKNTPNLALAHNKNSVIRKDYSILLGVGNIVSNSRDIAVFLSALLTGKIIPIKEVHNMLKDLYPMFDKDLYYGKGIMLYDFNEINQINNSWIGHSGGTENYKSIVAYDVKTKAIIAISINENISVESVAYKLLEMISVNQDN